MTSVSQSAHCCLAAVSMGNALQWSSKHRIYSKKALHVRAYCSTHAISPHSPVLPHPRHHKTSAPAMGSRASRPIPMCAFDLTSFSTIRKRSIWISMLRRAFSSMSLATRTSLLASHPRTDSRSLCAVNKDAHMISAPSRCRSWGVHTLPPRPRQPSLRETPGKQQLRHLELLQVALHLRHEPVPLRRVLPGVHSYHM